MGRAKALSVAVSRENRRGGAGRSQSARLQWPIPLRGRLMVGRLALDQVVKVRILAPQPRKPAGGRRVSCSAHRGSYIDVATAPSGSGKARRSATVFTSRLGGW